MLKASSPLGRSRVFVLEFLTRSDQDECASFRFRLLKLYEVDGDKVFTRGIPELYPLIPLMKRGVSMAEEVNQALLANVLPGSKKADLLAVLRVFVGLQDKAKAVKNEREQDARMNVMAESPVYQKILKQGEAKGRAEGECKGRAEGEAEGR